jgi:hypothetical protein
MGTAKNAKRLDLGYFFTMHDMHRPSGGYVTRINTSVLMCEGCVRMRWKQFVVVALFAGGLMQPAAQTTGEAASPGTSVGAAVMARANTGDAAAEVQAGESYARAAAAEHSREQAAKDYEQAAAWYRKAADQNNLAGELHLAALYRDGDAGFPRDMAQAAAFYRKAAGQGDADAQATLGLLYSIGQGVPQSNVDAYFWLDLAADVKGPNQEKYAANRQMIGQHITADELTNEQDRVAAWKAAHPRPDSSH